MSSTHANATRKVFSAPVNRAAPKKSHVYYVWSPKLGRALSIFNRLELDAWVLAESEPEIQTFCEYPCSFQLNTKPIYPSFWVSRGNGDEFWFVKWSDVLPKFRHALEASTGLNSWMSTRNINIRLFDEAEIRRNLIKLKNWHEILHDLSIGAQYITDKLREDVLQLIRKKPDASIEEIIEQSQAVDEEIVLAAIYQLIQRGKVWCAELDSHPLNRRVRVSMR